MGSKMIFYIFIFGLLSIFNLKETFWLIPIFLFFIVVTNLVYIWKKKKKIYNKYMFFLNKKSNKKRKCPGSNIFVFGFFLLTTIYFLLQYMGYIPANFFREFLIN
jgi:hypothetical protein